MNKKPGNEIGDEQLLSVLLGEYGEFEDFHEIHQKIAKINRESRTKVFGKYFNPGDYIFPARGETESGLLNAFLKYYKYVGEFIEKEENGKYRASDDLKEIANGIKERHKGEARLKSLLKRIEK